MACGRPWKHLPATSATQIRLIPQFAMIALSVGSVEDNVACRNQRIISHRVSGTMQAKTIQNAVDVQNSYLTKDFTTSIIGSMLLQMNAFVCSALPLQKVFGNACSASLIVLILNSRCGGLHEKAKERIAQADALSAWSS